MVCSLATPSFADKKPLTVDGVPGIWMPVNDLDAIAARVSNLTELAATQDELVTAQRLQIKTSSQTIALLIDTSSRAQAYGDLGWSSYRDEVKRGAAWHNQPAFWLIAGAAIGGGIAVAVAVASN